MAATSADTSTVKIEPFKRGDDYLVARFFGPTGQNITDREYHGVRNAIMDMRTRDPQTARLFDKFLETTSKRGELPDGELRALNDGLKKNNMALGSLTNSIGEDLRLNRYNPSYRPEVVVAVNARPMVPSVVIGELRAAQVEGNFSIQRSDKPGSVTGAPISFDAREQARLLPPPETGRHNFNRDDTGSKLMKQELVTHIKVKSLFKGALGVGATVAAGLVAAAEPGATPLKVADAMIDTQIPGWQAARQGQACKAFGEVTGTAASLGIIGLGATATTSVALTAGAATGPLAPVTAAAVAAGGAALTVKASESAATLAGGAGEAACNAVSTGFTKVKTALGFGA